MQEVQPYYSAHHLNCFPACQTSANGLMPFSSAAQVWSKACMLLGGGDDTSSPDPAIRWKMRFENCGKPSTLKTETQYKRHWAIQTKLKWWVDSWFILILGLGVHYFRIRQRIRLESQSWAMLR